MPLSPLMAHFNRPLGEDYVPPPAEQSEHEREHEELLARQFGPREIPLTGVRKIPDTPLGVALLFGRVCRKLGAEAVEFGAARPGGDVKFSIQTDGILTSGRGVFVVKSS